MVKQTIEVKALIDVYVDITDEYAENLKLKAMEAVQEVITSVVFDDEMLVRKATILLKGDIHSYTTGTENIEFGDN